MRLVAFKFKSQRRLGLLDSEKGQIKFNLDVPSDLIGLSQFCGLPNLSRSGIEPLFDQADSTVALSDVSLLAPICGMEKVICVGANYAEHAREMGGKDMTGRVPKYPIMFSKFSSAISAPGCEIELPAISNEVDFEAELVVVIGTGGKHIAKEKAMDHVFGYCCGNDITARDWQRGKPGGQWLLGKTCDTFAPLGPMIVTKDEVPDPHDLRIRLRLNGELMQDSNTSRFIFGIDFLISHVSQFVTLKPGDLIFTGTPSGVGAGRKPPLFLKPGDQLEVEIDGLGVLNSSVVAAS